MCFVFFRSAKNAWKRFCKVTNIISIYGTEERKNNFFLAKKQKNAENPKKKRILAT